MKKILKAAAAAAAAAAVIILLVRTAGDNGADVMPVFGDVTDENRAYIETVYDGGYMFPSGGGNFGTDGAVTASEAAFAAVALYEDMNGAARSFDTYYTGQTVYTETALGYGIWPQISALGEEKITGEEAAAVLAVLAEDAEGAGITYLKSLENYTYAGSVLKLYNLGITTGRNAAAAFPNNDTISRGAFAQLITQILKPETRLAVSLPDMAALEQGIKDLTTGYAGDWSVYFKYTETGQELSVNSHQVFSASLVKLFVIQTVYQRISDGLMSDSAELEELLRRMITYSDNDSWAEVARRIGGGSYSAGMARVTATAAAAGFSDSGTFYLDHPGNYNYTSVNDCGRYLGAVLDGTLVSAEYSGRILELLKQQEILHKIPAGVPDGVVTANKTGELDYMEGDAAIVYAPSGTYILVVIAEDLDNPGLAQPQIREISEYVYGFLNG